MLKHWQADTCMQAYWTHTCMLRHYWHTTTLISRKANSQNKLPYQLVLLNSISDEELTQTIGVICSSMGGGGLGLHHSYECTEFITPGAQMVSGCLSQVQVHVQETHTHRARERERDTAQARQTDVVDWDTAIVPFHQHDVVASRAIRDVWVS